MESEYKEILTEDGTIQKKRKNRPKINVFKDLVPEFD